MLQKEVKDCKKKLKEFFWDNLHQGTKLRTVWDESKAFVRGYFIQQNREFKKKRKQKVQVVLDEIKIKKKKIKIHQEA